MRFLLILAALVSMACAAPEQPAKVVSQSASKDLSALAAGSADWVVGSLADLDRKRSFSVTATVPSGTQAFVILTNTSPLASHPINVSAVADVMARSGLGEAPPQTRALTVPRPARYRVSLEDVRPDLKTPSPRTVRAAGRALKASPPPVPGISALGFIDAFTNTSIDSTEHGTYSGAGRTLHVWVADNAWSADGTTFAAHDALSPDHFVTQAMVDALAAKFLGNGTDDVYGWDTAIFGSEWPALGAPTGYDGVLIDGGGNIHIFVANLNPGGTDNGVLEGYFWAGNNYLSTHVDGSNDKILFAVDADTTATQPNEIYSTLAHEFQHMIQFYQKQVLKDVGETDTWINEMASMAAEDLLADPAKLNVEGPRGLLALGEGSPGLIQGRLPLFNYEHELIPLTGWLGGGNVLLSYSNAYAFGAWLTRNYGGPALWHDIVQSPLTNYKAVVSAVNANGGVNESFASLTQKWGLAVLLAKSQTKPYRHSAGSSGFVGTTEWSGNATFSGYNAGSINLDNYTYNDGNDDFVGPYIYASPPGAGAQVAAGGSYLYWDGTVSGTQYKRTLQLPAGLAATVVFQRPNP